MIANLMTTLLLALGVATGNVSSNVYKGGNAFNHEKVIEHHDEKPVNKAHESKTLNYNKVNEYNVNGSVYGIRHEFTNKKYYLENKISNDTTIANIYSTSYITDMKQNTNFAMTAILAIYRITPTIQVTDAQLTLDYAYTQTNNNNYAITTRHYIRAYKSQDSYNEYQDLTIYSAWDADTLNRTDLSILSRKAFNFELTNVVGITSSQTDIQVPPNSNSTRSQQFTLQTLGQNEPVTVIISIVIDALGSQTNQGMVGDLDSITLEGDVLPINYEVVDIPNLIFTILTMPFAFYSTAFNLTIFSGTPYALNFGNLVLTIVAAMILLYLIKKIIK